jgi:plastocyanin
LFWSCGDSTAPAAGADTVEVRDNTFSPDPLQVTPGATVTWNWVGTVAHNVTSDDGSFASSESKASGTHVVTFTTAGTFHYHCTLHGTATSGMRGAIVVKADSLAGV